MTEGVIVGHGDARRIVARDRYDVVLEAISRAFPALSPTNPQTLLSSPQMCDVSQLICSINR